MTEYIKRDDAVCAIREFSKTAVGIATEALVWAENVILDIVPSADVAEVRHGKWKLHGEPPWYVIECSECGEKWHHWQGYSMPNFCSNCGADMRGGT